MIEIKEKLIEWLSDEYSPESAREQIETAKIEKVEAYIITYPKTMHSDIVTFNESGEVVHLNGLV